MKKLVTKLVVILALTSAAIGQEIAGTIEGVFGDPISDSLTVEIPNYGVHGYVYLRAYFSPEDVRDMALPIFRALAATRDTTVSVSVHFNQAWDSPDYVIVFQKLDGAVSAYLDGQPF